MEIKTILADENASGPWTPSVSGDPTLQTWARSDQATAMYDQQKHMVLLTSLAMAQVGEWEDDGAGTEVIRRRWRGPGDRIKIAD